MKTSSKFLFFALFTFQFFACSKDESLPQVGGLGAEILPSIKLQAVNNSVIAHLANIKADYIIFDWYANTYPYPGTLVSRDTVQNAGSSILKLDPKTYQDTKMIYVKCIAHVNENQDMQSDVIKIYTY